MSFLNRIVADLRDKRLIALAAAALLVALIAVPLLLSKGASSTPVAQAPAPSQSLAPPSGLPVVNTASSPTGGKLKGSSRDPFAQIANATTSATATARTTSTTGSTGTSTASAGTTSTNTSSGSSTGTSTSTSSIPAPTTPITTATPKPAPSGLTSTQSYEVKLAITDSSGGLDTIDPLERLSVLPGANQPLLVELGVLKGGDRVLFAVQPGAVVGGPGTCIPGPVDCEILSLGQDQTESLGKDSTSGIKSVALFAVTGITAVDHSSASAADKAREQSSAAGRALLSASSSPALSLFHYDPSIGAIVDLRNLTVGG
jgi:hypothetical protein